jgi:MFS family permease
LLFAVVLELVLIDLGVGLTTPVLPLYARSLGASIAITGTVVAVIGISRTLTDLPAGYLATKIDRRLLLTISPLLVFGSAAIAAMTPNYWLLIPACFLEGMGMSLVNTISMIVLADIVANKPNRGRIMSLYQAARRGGNGIGPLVGGLIANLINYRGVYVVYAILTLGSFVYTVFRLDKVALAPIQVKTTEVKQGKKKELFRLLVTPGFILITLVAFSFFFGRIASRRFIIPMVGQQTLGLAASSIGLALTLGTVANLLTLYFIGNLSDKIGSRPVVFISGLLSAASLVTYTLTHNLLTFILASIFWGFCTGFGGPARNVFLMDICPKSVYPLALSVYRTVADVGFFLGPLVLGLVGECAGFTWSLYLAAGVFFVVSTMFYVFTGGKLQNQSK